MFTCTGHLLLPQPLFALPLPSRQGRDNSQIKHGRKRLCLTAEGQAGAESCYPGFVPQVLTMFPCFHHSRVQMTVSCRGGSGKIMRSHLWDGTSSKALFQWTRLSEKWEMLPGLHHSSNSEIFMKKLSLIVIVPSWGNVAEVCVHWPVRVVVQDSLSS